MVCSHDADVSETAVFTNATPKNDVLKPGEKRVRETTLETVNAETGARRIVYRALAHFEAPNWSPDGKLLYFNQQGKIYTIPVTGGKAQQLDTGDCTRCNNDHGLSADGKKIYFNSDRTGLMKIWRMNPGGSEQQQVTTDPDYADWFAHPSPDGKHVAFVSYRFVHP